MQRKMLPEADKYTKQNHKRRTWQKFVRVMACVVVFCTTYALILPAITMEKDPLCGLEEHTHSESCYTQVTSVPVTKLACTYESLGIHQHDEEECYDEEENLICEEIDFIVHEHDESCVDENGETVCELPEIKEHEHTEECYHSHTEDCYTTQRGELTCEQEESEGHAHDDTCYESALICEEEHEHEDACYEKKLICQQEETAGHTHDDSCYEQVQVFTCEIAEESAEQTLICEEPVIKLHTHGDTCYRLDIHDDGTEEKVLTCTQQEVFEHVHSEDCFQIVDVPVDTETLTCQEDHDHSAMCYGTWEMTCGFETEHTHTLECHSDKTADLETEETWTANLPEITGTWRDDLLAIAESQLGYKESEKNYIVEADGETLSGYNRYGAWYASVSGDDSYAYAPWNVTFLFFDLYHAGIGIGDFPYEEDCAAWIDSLSASELYRAAWEYAPNPGDLIFVDTDGDGEADRAGLVSEVLEDTVTVIEGDYDGAVTQITYTLPALTAAEETAETTEATEAAEVTEINLNASFTSIQLLSDGQDAETETTEAAEATETVEAAVVGYADMLQAQLATVQVEETEATLLALEWKAGSSYIYLNVNSLEGWHNLSAKAALAYQDTNGNWCYQVMENPVNNNNDMYRTVLPSDMKLSGTLIFCRVKSDATGNGEMDSNWSIKYNQTGDLQLSEASGNTNVYKLTGWNNSTMSGQWDGYQTPVSTGSTDDDDDETGETTDTLPEVANGCRRVFYDATLSKLSYNGDWGTATIPVANGNNEGSVIYCHYWDGSEGSIQMTRLNGYEANSRTWNDVYYADIPSGAKSVLFYSSSSINTYPGDSSQTINLTIPSNYTYPCFYGDSSDRAIYDKSLRSGYWGEAFTIRDAEKGKGTDVVDIDSETFTAASDTLYVSSTFYDYYTDYELNGYNRDDYNGDSGVSFRNWYTFRQFNQALSDYYQNASVSIPIYEGHFQPSISGWGYQFSAIASTLNLYGYANYNNFFSTNNSVLDIYGSQSTSYDEAAQGLASDTLNADGIPNTAGKEVAMPFFNTSFLSGNNSKNTKLGEVYTNVSFPFTKQKDGNGIDYWTFDSANTTLEMKRDNGSYYLKDVGNQGWSKNLFSNGTTTPAQDSNDHTSTTYGFFPFNKGSATSGAQGSTYNYGFGCKLDINFRLTENGKVKDASGTERDIVFQFSGDDDVWVYIDGKLVLDVGGEHGRTTGTINFADKVATVSKVKASAGSSTSGTDVQYNFSSVLPNDDNQEEHTLTMFYMERGMWESNMKITFNFPDENQLEVEKDVDTTTYKVNSLFTSDDVGEDVFGDQKLFTFKIMNQATHFGEVKANTGTTDDTVNPIKVADVGYSAKSSYSGNTFATTTYDGESCLKWYAKESDGDSTWRHRRYGVLTLDNSINISEMSTLSFYMWYDDSGEFELGELYLQLVDGDVSAANIVQDVKDNNNDNAFGCIGSSSSLAGKTYGTPNKTKGTWVKITLDLSKFDPQTGGGFDKTKVKYIRFGCNSEATIYLRDFVFSPAATASEPTGFITQQYDIPDYGSATSGKLENAYGAVYSSANSMARAFYMVGTDGTFVLEDGEVVNFHDQFRRGSYIYLEEVMTAQEQALYETSWTMYENEKPVTSMVDDDTAGDDNDVVDVANTSLSMKDVSGYTVNDGRKELVKSGQIGGYEQKNAYTEPKRPTDGGFVFRSYADPDSTATTTKLKVKFTNKVKTGSLEIKKEGVNLDGKTFTFVVEFYNVGGLGLESSTITTQFTLTAGDSETISGIPLNTQYNIYELKEDPDVSLDSVDGGEYITTTYGDYTAYKVSGTINNTSTHTVTYTNIPKPVVSVTVTKEWKASDNTDLNDTVIPSSINVQLQVYKDGSWQAYENNGFEGFQSVSLNSYNYWSYTFGNLDKYVDYEASPQVPWRYRVVELDESGDAVTGNTVTFDGKKYNVSYGTVDTSGSTYTQTITNTQQSAPSLQITKLSTETDKDGNNIKLEKISFTLTEVKADGTNGTPLTATTDADGIAKFENLAAGTYKLTEVLTEAQAKLYAPAGPWEITVTESNGTFTITSNDLTVAQDSTDNLLYTTTIHNTPWSYELPETGGTGTYLYTLGGIVLMALPLLYGYNQWRKRERRAAR